MLSPTEQIKLSSRSVPAYVSCVLLFTFSLVLSFQAAAASNSMPDELYQGMIKFELESGNHFNALVLMDEDYAKAHPVDYASALNGFNVKGEVFSIIDSVKKQKKVLDPQDIFNIGKVQYEDDQCIPALKSFQKLKNKLSLDDKQKWAFYRANCFIKLNSNKKAGQVLTDILGGVWASYAYYNLAMSYAEGSRDKTKSLVALRVAESLNQGETKEEKSLNDRINLSAGALYLESGKPDLAIKFFKKVHLDSDSSAHALYLNGLSHLELGDFRSATQSWFSTKKYSLVIQSASESLLAIPYAYERSGYISQALESYLQASSHFENELEIIDKIDALLEKHGAQKILLEESEIAGLEWFLAKDVVTNTMRASYYNYFMQDYEIYDVVELHAELSMLFNSLEYWQSQLVVFNKSLKNKKKNFKSRSKKFSADKISARIDTQSAKLNEIKGSSTLTPSLSKNLKISVMLNSISTLENRLKSLKEKIKKGQGRLNNQLSESKRLNRKIKVHKKRLRALLSELDSLITEKTRARLAKLRITMLSNFERAEQGLIHIFEGIAESKKIKKRNLLDGRYK
jgi:hypothetical protein